MSDNLTLYDIESGLLELVAARDEAQTDEDRAQTEAAIACYVQAEIKKKRLHEIQTAFHRQIDQEKTRVDKLLNVIIPISVAFSEEKDFNRLLERILIEAKTLCNADAGTLYLRTDADQLKFEILCNDTLNIQFGGTTGKPISFPPLPLYTPAGTPNHKNVATYTALNGLVVNIEDAYQADGFDFSGTKAFDAQTGYRSMSFLTIPLRKADARVIGVLQLINALNPDSGEIIPFSPDLTRLVESLSSLAAVALEAYMREQNLMQQIEALQIEVNEARKRDQVAQITETDYFQHLQDRAQSIRRRTRKRNRP